MYKIFLYTIPDNTMSSQTKLNFLFEKILFFEFVDIIHIDSETDGLHVVSTLIESYELPKSETIKYASNNSLLNPNFGKTNPTSITFKIFVFDKTFITFLSLLSGSYKDPSNNGKLQCFIRNSFASFLVIFFTSSI